MAQHARQPFNEMFYISNIDIFTTRNYFNNHKINYDNTKLAVMIHKQYLKDLQNRFEEIIKSIDK